MIKLVNLTKSYPLFAGGKHYVFKNFSFGFPKSYSVGLMGGNGVGKSTLMKLSSGAELPDGSKIITNKRLSWSLDLGGGIQDSLSARGSVKFVARVYGYKGEKLLERVKFVEEFAELGKFFDEPMKGYSAGMGARVTFRPSMAFGFNCYLIDEAGAVGDLQFGEKNAKLYKERLSCSRVIMVSHNVTEIKKWCDKIIFIKNGKITVYDDVDEGIAIYQGKV